MPLNDFSLYTDGRPDLNIIRTNFPEHGSGNVEHTTTWGDRFRFHVTRDSGEYEVLIFDQPPYGRMSSSWHSTHRLPAGPDTAKICFRKQPQDLPTTITLAMWWAECTSRYIRDGKAWN